MNLNHFKIHENFGAHNVIYKWKQKQQQNTVKLHLSIVDGFPHRRLNMRYVCVLKSHKNNFSMNIICILNCSSNYYFIFFVDFFSVLIYFSLLLGYYIVYSNFTWIDRKKNKQKKMILDKQSCVGFSVLYRFGIKTLLDACTIWILFV